MKTLPDITPSAARPRIDPAAETATSPVPALQEQVVQAAFRELQAQNQWLSARGANLAQEAAAMAIKLDQAQAELAAAREALEQAQPHD